MGLYIVISLFLNSLALASTLETKCREPLELLVSSGETGTPERLRLGEVPYTPERIRAVPDQSIQLLLGQFLEQQEQMTALRKSDPPLAPPRLQRLPEGIPPKFQPAFERIFHLFKDRDQDELFLHAQRLEYEIYYRSLVDKMPYASLCEKVLAEREKRHGFEKALTLGKDVYSDGEFLEMLGLGALFNDPAFHDVGRKSQGAAAHGSTTHRVLQWHGIMRDMELHPELYAGVRAVDLYKYLGDGFAQERLNYSAAGAPADLQGRHLWYYLFDDEPTAGKPTTFSPEGQRTMHLRLPLLGPLLH